MLLNSIFIVCALVLGGYWIILVFNCEFKKAFFLQIIMFPFTSKAQDYISIDAYSPNLGYTQQISFTTFMIIFLFFAIVLNHTSSFWRINKKTTKFINLFLSLALVITLSQFFSHTIFSAFMLSIEATWQYFLLFYILIVVIKIPDDFLSLINAIFIFSVINIIFRISLGSTGGQQIFHEVSKNTNVEVLTRASTLALGPAVSYAGYLAIFITLGIGMYRVTKKKIYILYLVLIFMELLNTFTRGGLAIIPLLFILMIWKSERKFYKKYLFLLIPLVLFLWDKVILYFSIRNDASNLESDSSIWLRTYVLLNYFNNHFHFSFIGNGIANQTQVWIPLANFYLPLHNAFLEILDQCGMLAFILFLVIIGFALFNLLDITRNRDKYVLDKIYLFIPYLLISFIQWIIYANTTSTSILFYYPYEGTIIFYILLFSPFIIMNIIPDNCDALKKKKISYNF